jgi:regulator of protease activity HflC (stomatin/prohibitin superfamily)
MGSTVLWFGAVVGVLAVASASFTLVPRDERRVVTRRGRVRRVVERGLAWRWPVLERFEVMRADSHEHPVAVRATTIDAVPVLVLLETVVRVPPPEPGGELADPWRAVEEEIQRHVALLVSRLPVARLRDALRAAEGRLLVTIREAVRPLGVVLQAVQIVEIDLPLTSDRGPD